MIGFGMTWFRTKRGAIAVTILVLLLLTLPSTGFNRINYSGYVSWPNATAHMYLDGPGFPSGSTWWQALRNSMYAWTNVSKCAFRFTWTDAGSGTGTYYSTSWHTDGANDVFWISGLLDYYTYAVTMFYYNVLYKTPVLYDTDVMFNWDIGWSTTGNPSLPDFESVAIHEFGHVLGLDEVNDPTAIMYGYLNPGQITRTLTLDDKEGARAIYPEGEYEPPPPPPPSQNIDTVSLAFLDVSLSETEARVGQLITVTGEVKNVDTQSRNATVNALVMQPAVISKTTNMTLEPDEEKDIEFEAVVIASPGRYPVSVKVTGWDGTDYSSGGAEVGHELTVTRDPLGMVMQDTVITDLGPYGEDRVRVPLLKGTKAVIDLRRSSFSWKGEREVSLVSPSGKVLQTVSGPDTVSLKSFRAKEAGDYVLEVTNHGSEDGTYVLLCTGKPKKKKVKGKLTLEIGEEQGELVLAGLPARCELDLSFKAKTKGFEPPMITGYYTPSKVRVEYENPVEGFDAFSVTENGDYRFILRLPDGPAPKRVRVKAKAKITMVDGLTHRN
jgi:hypothetical protein